MQEENMSPAAGLHHCSLLVCGHKKHDVRCVQHDAHSGKRPQAFPGGIVITFFLRAHKTRERLFS